MVQQQAIRETVTEEGITKKAQEIKEVCGQPCSCSINDSLSQVQQASSAQEQLVHLPGLITGLRREGNAALSPDGSARKS